MSKLSLLRLREAVATVHRTHSIPLLSRLVEFPSLTVNASAEREAQAHLKAYIEETFNENQPLSVDFWEQEWQELESEYKTAEGYSQPWTLGDWPKPQLVAKFGGDSSLAEEHRSLILNGHMDVVPTGPTKLWSVCEGNPFKPVIRTEDGEERMYGRGAGDMKAGLVAALNAILALQSCGFRPAAPVYFQSVLDEECTGLGALACMNRGYTADCAIIPEPFPQIMTGQLGVLWTQVTVYGTPAHVLDTSAGTNAIDTAWKLWTHIQQLEEKWNVDEKLRHPEWADFKHPVNFNLGRIDGGDWASTVASHCTMQIRIGFWPTQTVEEVKNTLEEHIKAFEGLETYEISYRGFSAEGYVLGESSPGVAKFGKEWESGQGDVKKMVDTLDSAHKEVYGTPAVRKPVTCTTDARFFYRHGGIPCTCFGPEYTRSIHGLDESVSLNSMQRVTEVLALFIANWCGLEPIR